MGDVLLIAKVYPVNDLCVEFWMDLKLEIHDQKTVSFNRANFKWDAD